MGKKKHGGGGDGKRPSSGNGSGSSSGSLVVVNPMLMQSVLQKAPQPKRAGKPMQHKQKSKKRTLNAQSDNSNNGNGIGKKNKKSKTQHGNDSFERKPSKRAQKSPVVSASVVSVLTSARLFGAADGLKTPISLVVSSMEHMLVGTYWVALSRAAKRSCVIVVPNNHTTLTPQRVASVLRNLGMQTIAIHKKMTAGQRNDSVERLARTAREHSTNISGSSSSSVVPQRQLLLVTPEHFAAGAVCAAADVLLVGVAAQQPFSKASAIFQVLTSGDVSSYRPELQASGTGAVLPQVLARVKIATQIAEITERLASANASDVDSKWANKLARGAGLGDDDDASDNDVRGDLDNESGSRKKQKKRALSPDEQRLQALSQRLAVLVARKLDVPASTTASGGMSTSSNSTSSDTQHAKEKLDVLGIVTLTAAVGATMGDERLSAQTQWLDEANGAQFGGAWTGAVRHGASKDATSLAVRTQLCAAKQKQQHKVTTSEPVMQALSEWQPNRQPADDIAKWGGAFGKVCGHNEVVMHALRPFYPQQVLNSRVCSRVFPAPGNQGFDGCLEHLRLQCRAHARAMTLWDTECFVFIGSDGRVTWTRKNQLLPLLSLAGLQCLVDSLRRWTLASDGQLAPARVLQALQLCCALGCSDASVASSSHLSPRLEPKLLKRIMSFAIGGSVRLWKQIVKVPRLESEVVY